MEAPAREAVRFQPTRWSVVSRAASPTHPEAHAALGRLCSEYWLPLYVFARQRGSSQHDAEDLTQGFFAALIAKNSFATADRARGRLRTFLLAAFRHYIADAARHDHARKRCGNEPTISIDQFAEAEWQALEPREGETPETHYDRQWTIMLLERTLARLEAERRPEVEILRPFLSLTVAGSASYAEAAARLRWTVNATRVAVFRLRQRFRKLLLDEVASTLPSEDPQSVEAELRELLVVFDR
jgi:RNA polymerase sigma factor (sigma-70 family)